MPPSTETAVAVFARAPVPGAAKTRLMPRLGADGAAELQQRFIAHALETATAAALGPVTLFCAPDRSHPFFAACAARFGIALADQRGADLGARMRHACEALLGTVQRILIIGSDCPALTPGHLRHAARRLDEQDAVVWPAEDGGYVLIALRRPAPTLFEGIDWGSNLVMAQTRERLRMLGWRWDEPEPLWDVDRAEDYDRLVGTNGGVPVW